MWNAFAFFFSIVEFISTCNDRSVITYLYTVRTLLIYTQITRHFFLYEVLSKTLLFPQSFRCFKLLSARRHIRLSERRSFTTSAAQAAAAHIILISETRSSSPVLGFPLKATLIFPPSWAGREQERSDFSHFSARCHQVGRMKWEFLLLKISSTSSCCSVTPDDDHLTAGNLLLPACWPFEPLKDFPVIFYPI